MNLPAPAALRQTVPALFLVFLLLLSASCRRAEPPPVLGEIPDFALVDADGRPFTKASMKGSVWVVNLFFTSCPTACPLLMKRVAKLRREVKEAGVGRVKFLSVSVDPTSDTPARLKDYAGRHGYRHDDWVLATGTDAAVRLLAGRGLRLGVGDEPDLHSQRVSLVDCDQNARAGIEIMSGNGVRGTRDVIASVQALSRVKCELP